MRIIIFSAILLCSILLTNNVYAQSDLSYWRMDTIIDLSSWCKGQKHFIGWHETANNGENTLPDYYCIQSHDTVFVALSSDTIIKTVPYEMFPEYKNLDTLISKYDSLYSSFGQYLVFPNYSDNDVGDGFAYITQKDTLLFLISSCHCTDYIIHDNKLKIFEFYVGMQVSDICNILNLHLREKVNHIVFGYLPSRIYIISSSDGTKTDFPLFHDHAYRGFVIDLRADTVFEIATTELLLPEMLYKKGGNSIVWDSFYTYIKTHKGIKALRRARKKSYKKNYREKR